jgi:tryptophanyl-tRNA synthetase
MLLSGKSKEQVAIDSADMGWGQFKPLLTETIIESLKPIQERYYSLTQEQGQILEVLRQGAEKAEQLANKTLQNIKDALGFSIRG